ncbi:PREDICTED: ATPase inhibitor, mitochondrial [Miniopterus natalensis]|uniref:ATPase inhibitor, mitochondrial n=1 Tax=Miniopterus natalensis TaxID=291302 RepID=UPI0007A6C389|nr:PREDICTED: ATPase inhibitor, mitochondrial [Miniopterus natalensis]
MSCLSPQSDHFSSDSGAIREAGGAFGKKEKAEEDRYFRERSKEQLAALKKHHEDEIIHHKKEIERLQKEIERHKHTIKKLKDSVED